MISGLDFDEILDSINLKLIFSNIGEIASLFTGKGRASEQKIREIIKQGIPQQLSDYQHLPDIETFFRDVGKLRTVFMDRDENVNVVSNTFKQYINECFKTLEETLLENYTNFDMSTVVDKKLVLSNEDAWNAFKGPNSSDNENFFVNQRDMAILAYMSNIVSVASDIGDKRIKAAKGDEDIKSELFLYQDRKLLVDVKLLNDSGNIDYMGGLFLSLLQLSNAHTRSSEQMTKINLDLFYEALINAIRATAYLKGHNSVLSIDSEGNEKTIFMQKLKKLVPTEKIMHTIINNLLKSDTPQQGGNPEGSDGTTYRRGALGDQIKTLKQKLKMPGTQADPQADPQAAPQASTPTSTQVDQPESSDAEKQTGASLDNLINEYANKIVTAENDKQHLKDVIARFPSLNNDGKIVDFLLGYNENGVFVLPTKELTSEQAEIPARQRTSAAVVSTAAPKQSSMVMTGTRKATYHKE
jgi:hypothetical protein